MKQKTNVSVVLAFLMAFIIIACNEQPKKDEPTKTDVAKSEPIPMPAYAFAVDQLGLKIIKRVDDLHPTAHEVAHIAGGQHQLVLDGGGGNQHVGGAASDALGLKLPA